MLLSLMCIHIKDRRSALNPDGLVAAISYLSGPDLERVRKAAQRRREQLVKRRTVVERRNHGRGILQLEYRANPKAGTKRGPYWYFYWREEGRQRSLYVGKTDDPEGALSGKLLGE
jgi:hypothetical protein